MTVFTVIAVAGLAVIGVVIAARAAEATHWRHSLIAYQLGLPADITDEAVAAWLSSVAAITHRPRWSLLPLPPVGWEVVADQAGIRHFLLLSRHNAQPVLSALRANLPGVRLALASDYLAARPVPHVAAEATLTNRTRPLSHERGESGSAALLASLQPLSRDTQVIVQWLVTSAGTPPPVKQPPSQSAPHRLPWLVEGEAPIDAEAVRQQRLKYREPLLHATVRVGVAAPTPKLAAETFGHVWGHLQTTNAPGVRVVRRYLSSALVAGRLHRLKLPLLRWPLLLNARELTALAGWPLGELHLPGLALTAARQLPPPASLPRRGLVLAHSNYPGLDDRPLALSTRDRLRHSYIVGPTGVGKSWLLANLILQDVSAGYGVIAIDVKGDLIADVLTRLTAEAEDRLVVIDASKRDRPVGFNVLAHAGDEAARELVVDNVLHSFREIWAGFWGPRTDAILRGTLNTLTQARSPRGEALTLCEVVPLLTNAVFRRDVLERTPLTPELQAFWARYAALSEAERAQVIGPALNKVEAFTSRAAIRLLLGQSVGIDLADVFRRRQIVLLSLAKGQLGAETANLLGALCVASLWQATLARVQVPQERRRPVFAYIDEAQDIVRLPVAMADMLAQARGLGLGVTLANQYVAQLPEHIRTAILGTVRTQLTFQLDYDDARLLERRFEPLTKRDLMGLGAYEVALRPCVDGQTLSPITGVTLPLADPTQDATAVARRARERHGLPRAEVEAALRARGGVDEPGTRSFGRERRGGAT